MTRMHDKFRGFLALLEFPIIFSVRKRKTLTGREATCSTFRNTLTYWIPCGSGHTHSHAKIQAILKMSKNRPRSPDTVRVGAKAPFENEFIFILSIFLILFNILMLHFYLFCFIFIIFSIQHYFCLKFFKRTISLFLILLFIVHLCFVFYFLS